MPYVHGKYVERNPIYKPNGEQECERRRRQIARGQLKCDEEVHD